MKSTLETPQPLQHFVQGSYFHANDLRPGGHGGRTQAVAPIIAAIDHK
jgi:hypothetical protein